ncbi:ATP-dependent DNA helicase RecG [Paracoccus onubensis]|uniref:Probable DNA 3'-5' helicase RecG n=1 Tax=Paracoccus onubensis TaxID=1675788 RepID=A0A418SSC0_9RHOB|nr:ATP-dependent DNA helicase RecG [Paracoccus onubensis]RJE83822.1 ATP-dependent DNA helicase RecG [Paracoccus onubensis]
MPKGRPPSLFPLFAAIDTLPGIGPKGQAALMQMGIERPRDLIMTLPSSGITRRRIQRINQVDPPEIVIVDVTVGRHFPPKTRGRPWRVHCTDMHGDDLTLVFFHPRRDWIENQLPTGARRIVSGKVELFDGLAQMVHPDHILREVDPPPAAFEPVYPLSQGLTQRMMSKAISAAMEHLPEVSEWIDPQLLKERDWSGFADALKLAHDPQSPRDLSPDSPARTRLAYDEFLAHQMTLALVRREKRRLKGRPTSGNAALRRKVLGNLPWPPTNAQNRAVDEIATDMASDRRMNRLLQGDVGAGKTLVAMLSALIAVEAGGQAVLMAPTELLARQHARALEPLARAAGVRLAALTGRNKGDLRAQLLEDLAQGRIDILVGTHAVFQKDVHFKDLRLAIIDEQHRFGVAQRLELSAKGDVPPDMLIMTATPIPRSLALTQYGDLDLSVLDEKPPGRQPITTVMISDQRLDEVTARLKAALDRGARAYWVCPLVDESEVSDLTAAEARFQSLRAQFGEEVRLVHGQMPPDQRDAAMADFVSGRARILVATTVIEVGVDVPEATIMVIERAESFGLAQLHQLRGRVGRGQEASTCVLMYHAPLGETGARRLTTLRDTEDGFRIAEVDLEMRGAGDVIGTAQSGLPRFHIGDLEHQAGLMSVARQDARALLDRDPSLESARGRAVRFLMWFMQQDQAIRLISVG